MLIEKLSTISQKLFFLKPVNIAFALGCFVFIVYSFLFSSATGHNANINANVSSADHSLVLFAFMWSVLFNLFLTVFKSIPTKKPANKKISLIKRIKLSILRFFYFSFALFFIGLTAVILFLTIRMLRVWLNL